MSFRAPFCLAPLLVATSVLASEPAPASTPTEPRVDVLVADWRARHGASWRAHVALDTGRVEMLHGGRAEPRWTPRTDADYARLAREALASTFLLHGLDDATLELDATLHLPLGTIGSTDKMTVRFRQVVAGVPVERGTANVLLDMRGTLLSIQSTGLPRVAGFATTPALDARSATRRAVEWFRAELGLIPDTIGEPALVVDQVEVDGRRAPRLAWKVDVQQLAHAGAPAGRHVHVDAANGAVYRATDSVHAFDVSGSVSTLATPGLLPDTGSNPPTQHALRFARVTSGAVTTYTDANGDFTLPGVTAPASVTFEYANGTYADVQNQAGAEYALTQTLAAPAGNVVVLNAPATATVTAQANCARVIPLVRDFVKAINPSDTHVDFQVRANTATPGGCGAFYSGASINFHSAVTNCANSAYSTVIAHEEGHWLNDRYGTSNHSDGMGEGNADVWSMYVHDTPVIGDHLEGTTFVRSGTNTRPFCGDANPSCYGDIHTDGEPWMGAAWKIRTRLNAAYGDAPGDLIANSLFLAWMNAYDQAELKSIIETQWLTLDDDDGNIENGTPHYVHVDQGFRDQGFPGYALPAVAVTGVTDLPDTQDATGPFVVNATIHANLNPPVVSASLLYRVEGGSFATLAMSNVGGSAWTASIPSVPPAAHVEYYVAATDAASATGRYPAIAPRVLLDFDTGVVNVLRSYTFDTVGDEGWTHGSVGDASNPTDDWQRGTPEGKTGANWSDPSFAFSPSTCWGTDLGQGASNGAYDANVHAYLRSPAVNCTGATNVRVRFRRWLSVQGSASDQARVLVNGQQLYVNPTTNLDDGAWVQQELFLGPIADDNPSVQLDWRIRSNGTQNFGGWNVDDVRILWLAVPLPPCPAPTNFCVTSPNSVGSGAVMGHQGTPNISANNFELIATGVPVNSYGLFYYGTTAIQQPFGNGWRCVGGQTYRLGIVQADFLGDAHFALNFPALPGPISAGQVRRFQYWYRNPAGGGAGFNLSDGLEVTFCP